MRHKNGISIYNNSANGHVQIEGLHSAELKSWTAHILFTLPSRRCDSADVRFSVSLAFSFRWFGYASTSCALIFAKLAGKNVIIFGNNNIIN